MGNVHPYPRYLSREPSLHGHPTALKKYGLVSAHPGCKSAISRTLHLLLCHAKMLIPGRLQAPLPFPAAAPRSATPTQGKKSLSQGSCISPSWLCSSFLPLLRATGHTDGTDVGLAGGAAPHSQHSQLPHPHFPCPSLEVWFTPALRQSHFHIGPSGLSFLRDIMWLISCWGGRNKIVAWQSV